MPVSSRQPKRRNSLRHRADQFHPARFQRKRRCGNDASDYNEKRDRLMFEKDFPKNEQRERDSSNQKRRRVRFIQALEEEARVFPKASVSTMKTEKLWQLRAGQEKRHAAFEAGHDTLRDEMYHDSGLRQPGNERDE